jgi:ATP-binding cassette, subfamily B, bacterial
MAEGKQTHENLWDVTRGQRARYVAAMVAMALANLCMFGAPLVAKYAIDVVVAKDVALGTPLLVAPAQWLQATFGSQNAFAWYLLLSAVLAVAVTGVGGAFQYVRGRWSAVASEAIVRRLRETLYRHLHDLRAGYYDDADTGDLVQRCSSDVETLRVFLSSDVVEIGRSVLLVLGVTPILFWLDTTLACWALCLIPIIGAFSYTFFTQVKKVFQVTDEAEGEMTGVLQENLTGIRVVRAFARQDYEIAKFAEKNRIFRDHNNRLIRLMGRYWASADFVSLTQIGVVLAAGAFAIIDGRISVGTLFAFLTYEGMIIWPVRQLGRVLTDSGKAVVSLGRTNEILNQAEETLEPTPKHGRARGDIRIEHLTFGYDAARPVLRDFSLHVRPGETVAFVGAPGSGKSTLIRLLLKLYPYRQGSIRLDGQEVADVNRHWLRHQVGVVLQDPFLYSRSIAANLKVGRPDAPDPHVVQACLDAAIHDSIMELPDRYDALVGERGVTLSGGQRQRLALARALLKDPPVLVLDDSLSAVDTGTEGSILTALRARRGRHTTLIIAHRLSSVIDADRIVVLEGGRAVQIGPHAELAAVDGPYRHLCEIQGSLDAEIRTDVMSTAS